jgi:hypothetical protein
MSSRLIALILAAFAAGCRGGDFTSPADPLPAPGPGGADPGSPPPPDPGTPAPSPDISGRPVFAVDLANRLVLFGSESPDIVARILPITGLGTGHRIVSVDFRGESGLYGVGTDSRLYAIDTLSGVATAVGSPFQPEISGTHFGMLIDAETNQIRVQGAESDQNLLLRATTGELLSVDAPLAFAGFDVYAGTNPGVAGSAIRPSDGKVFGIEANQDILVRLPDPATGTLYTVGLLGTGTTLCVGFDIAEDGAALAALTQQDGSKLHTIDLESGTATLIGTIMIDSPVQGIAIVPGTYQPQPREARPVSARKVAFRPAVAPAACFGLASAG